jgi:molybdopterin molybdotransferase
MPIMSSTELRSVDDHTKVVAALLSLTEIEQRPLVGCAGLALGADLTAPISLPPFDNSAMDGYTVRSVDLAGATRERPVELDVTEDIPAGRTDSPILQPGTAHRIMTGAPVPPGADAVLPVERTDGGLTRVRLFDVVAPGANIRRVGEDVQVGDVVLSQGQTLGPAQLGAAAAVGSPALAVYRPPAVLVLSTGSELVEPGSPLRHGQIYESNGPMLAAAVRGAGGVAELVRFVADNLDAFIDALRSRLGSVDLVITSGGVSAGAYEVVKDALAERGVEFVSVAMQPGKPQGAGRFEGVPVVALPGNPVSALVSFEIFVRPALLAAGGHAVTSRPRLTAKLEKPLSSPAGRRQYRRGLYAGGSVSPVGGPGSHLLVTLAAANCLIEIAENVTELPAGTEVDLLLIG